MADCIVQKIVDALADVLRGITVVNGYNTDLGADVRTERKEVGIPTAPRCVVSCVGKHRPDNDGQRRPGVGRVLRGVIEFEVPASYANAMSTVYAADDDIDRCLRSYHQIPAALPVSYEETTFLDRPEGFPVIAAQIHWTTGYREREGD